MKFRTQARIWWPLVAALALWAPLGMAQSTGGQIPNLGQMFANFSSSAVALTKLVQVVAFAVGAYFLILSLVKVKQAAESGGREAKFSGAMMIFVASIFLMVLPTTINIVTGSTGITNSSGGGGLFGYSGGNGLPDMSGAMNGIILFIELVGNITFVRGLINIKKMGEGNRDVTGLRVIIELVFGLACIHIVGFVGILANSVAPGLNIPGMLGGL